MFGAASQKLLHRCSHKKLRDSSAMSSHKRQNSTWSDSSRSTSSGSESSRRDGSTVEWDPLRLHPVDHAPRCTERRYQHQEEAEQRLRQHRPGQPGFSLEIYEGFDFGFGSPLPPMTSADRQQRQLRVQRSEAYLRLRQRHSTPEPTPPAKWGGSSSSVSEPPSPITRRPQPASFNEADYFLKRGGWKRRGIVFANDELLATDEDVFEIP